MQVCIGVRSATSRLCHTSCACYSLWLEAFGAQMYKCALGGRGRHPSFQICRPYKLLTISGSPPHMHMRASCIPNHLHICREVVVARAQSLAALHARLQLFPLAALHRAWDYRVSMQACAMHACTHSHRYMITYADGTVYMRTGMQECTPNQMQAWCHACTTNGHHPAAADAQVLCCRKASFH